MQAWQKLGVIPIPDAQNGWIHSHAYIPCPFLLNPDVIRVVVAFWDARKIGRIGYIDVSARKPLSVLGYSHKPALDIGEPGTFDDNGVSPLCVIRKKGALRLYYAGWQLSDKVRYFMLTGLAQSTDDGASFERVQKTPVLERSHNELILRSGGFVFRHEEKWRMVYAAGSTTIPRGGSTVPTYEFRWLESDDGIRWPVEGKRVFAPDRRRGEFGFGRPHIQKEGALYRMWYGIRTETKPYIVGYAESADGSTWRRMDDQMDEFNREDWEHDRQMRFCSSVIDAHHDTYMFYDGNNYGEKGLCLARLKK